MSSEFVDDDLFTLLDLLEDNSQITSSSITPSTSSHGVSMQSCSVGFDRHSWHEHVYGRLGDQPTPHYIENILGVQSNATGQFQQEQAGRQQHAEGKYESTLMFAHAMPQVYPYYSYPNMQPATSNSYERVPSPARQPVYPNTARGNPESQSANPKEEVYRYNPILENNMNTNRYSSSQYYLQRGSSMYSALPSKKSQFFSKEVKAERSVTPVMTKGLEMNYNTNSADRRVTYSPQVYEKNLKLNHQHSLPTNFYKTDQNPDVVNLQNAPLRYNSFTPTRAGSHSPIDPRHSGGFQSSTPSSKTTDLRAAMNLENKLSLKKSTMSNEELTAIIHKSKKRMDIETEETPRSPPVTVKSEAVEQTVKSHETGYLDNSRSRLRWSPSKGEYVDVNSDIDKLLPPNDSRSRQSWACSDRKGPKVKETPLIDFKRLLLQKSMRPTPKKLSAVEQLKLSKDQIKPPQSKFQPDMSIQDMSRSPRRLANRRYLGNAPGSPNREPKPAPKTPSSRSQTRFARSDVLSSTKLENCSESSSGKKSTNYVKRVTFGPSTFY